MTYSSWFHFPKCKPITKAGQNDFTILFSFCVDSLHYTVLFLLLCFIFFKCLNTFQKQQNGRSQNENVCHSVIINHMQPENTVKRILRGGTYWYYTQGGGESRMKLNNKIHGTKGEVQLSFLIDHLTLP